MHEAYLDSIVNWTNSRDLRLVLVVTPLTQSYREAVPESASEVLGRVLREMARRRGVIIADWAGADIPEAWFLDHDHVNALGAIEVSRMLQELLEPAP